MDRQWVVFTVILMLNALITLAIAVVLMRQRPKPGIRSMSLILVGLSIWSFAYAMIALSPALDAKHFWLKVENVGIVLVPVLLFLFTLKHTHLDGWLKRKPVMLSFWIIPAITLLLLFTGRWFELYYTSTQVASETGGPLIISRGPWYFVQLLQNYTLNVVVIGVLFWRYIHSRNVYRSQLLFLLMAILIPVALNIVYQLIPDTLPFFAVPVDLTPLSFSVTAILFSESIFGLRLFDLVPIARDTVMEHIPEMVFVVDAFDRVVDANSMARQWLGKSLQEISGQDPIVVFRKWPQLLNRFFHTEYSREEIEIPGDPPRTLELVVTPIYNRSNVLEGRVILAHDITDRKVLENELKQANESLEIQLARIKLLQAELREQAMRDPLTGAFNRRFFAESLDKESARSARENTPFSVIIMDIDHFKQVNDTHGHKCGDIVLQTLAEFLRENTRQSDIVCRYGGEEFVILMPDALPEAAYERAEIFRKEFQGMTVEYGEAKVKCTLSAGIASCPIHSSNADTLLTLADYALYQSKSNGRNCVTVYRD